MIGATEPWEMIESVSPLFIIPPCPEDVIPDRVLEKLDQDFQYLVDTTGWLWDDWDLTEFTE